VYARDGTLLATLYTQNRIWVPIAKIPKIVREAFVANEDHNFYRHHGVDFGGIARAAIADYRHEEFQGASTITQQLARALFLSNEVSISRKIQEALLAMEIERYYTKDEILERYLNLIYFGSGAYGIEAAAHTYFGTDVGRLSVAQAAQLAGLPAAPSDYSPYVSPERAHERQRHVLGRERLHHGRAGERGGVGAARPHRRTPDGLTVVQISLFHDVRDAHPHADVRRAGRHRRRSRGRHVARHPAAAARAGSRRLGRRAFEGGRHQRARDGARRDPSADG
jgi:penicillin-binding protein 1A